MSSGAFTVTIPGASAEPSEQATNLSAFLARLASFFAAFFATCAIATSAIV